MIAGALLFATTVSPICAATITTLDGKSFDGPITFDQNSISISPKNGTKTVVELSNILRASILPGDRPLLRGVILTSGEVIAADAITRLDSNGVRLVRPGGVAVALPLTDLASVIFRPVTPEMQKHVPSGHTGAILDDGDFSEGDVTGLEGNQLKISSVLFGIQSFDINRQARAAVLQDAAVPDADEIVHLTNGSVLLAKSISLSDGRVSIDDVRLGPVSADYRELVSISRGTGAFDALSGLTPSKIDGPPTGYAIDATTTGAPIALLNMAVAHGIGERPGVSITWEIVGKYKSLIGSAGVPIGLVPVQRLQFVVLGDGKEIFRSTPRSSVDDPAAVAVSLTDVKSLTLRVEGADASAPGAVGLWGDPILVRGKP